MKHRIKNFKLIADIGAAASCILAGYFFYKRGQMEEVDQITRILAEHGQADLTFHQPSTGSKMKIRMTQIDDGE